jgi:HlyD family secretion protein
LVLDEATSSLDNISEKLIMDAINDFSESKTVIMIAHRLSTVKNCDLIYFLDKGKVLDSGSYKDLITNNIHFKKMVNTAE